MSEITEVTVPACFEEADEYGTDRFPDESVDAIPDCWRNPNLEIREEKGSRAAYPVDPDFGYYPDPDFGYESDPSPDYCPDVFPDYDAHPVMLKKEAAGKRKQKTILYTPKTGYRVFRQ